MIERFLQLVETKQVTVLDLDTLLETMPKSANERYLRQARLKPGNPLQPVETSPAKKAEHQLQKVGDNDPTRTPRGKASVRKQANKNKLQPQKFAEAIEFVREYQDKDPALAIAALPGITQKPELLTLLRKLGDVGALRRGWVAEIESVL